MANINDNDIEVLCKKSFKININTLDYMLKKYIKIYGNNYINKERGYERNTLLSYICANNNITKENMLEVLKYMLENNANMYIVNNYNHTLPLKYLCANKIICIEIFKLLKEYDKNNELSLYLNYRCINSMSSFNDLCINSHITIELIEYIVNICECESNKHRFIDDINYVNHNVSLLYLLCIKSYYKDINLYIIKILKKYFNDKIVNDVILSINQYKNNSDHGKNIIKELMSIESNSKSANKII